MDTRQKAANEARLGQQRVAQDPALQALVDPRFRAQGGPQPAPMDPSVMPGLDPAILQFLLKLAGQGGTPP
jgi:hypothetical protein